jgi:hypothetical protein
MDEIQKIVFEIADRCSRRRIPINDMLAAFVAKTVILESPERFQLDRALKPEDIEELVGLAVDRLSKEDDPPLETLRMQVAFDAAYVQRQEELEKERAATKRSYSVIEQAICALKLQSTKDVGGMGQMNRLIVAALLTKTGQSTQNEVYQKEVAAALESVLPRANLHAFTSLAYSDKRDRLADLHLYVLGIRLFNKALGKGGAGLPDKIAEAYAATRELSEMVSDELGQAKQEVDEYTIVIEHVLQAGADAMSGVPLKRLQDELTNRRQYLSFLESFQEEVEVNAEQVHQLVEKYEAELDELRDLVGRKSAVPKERVYPIFEGLARKWTQGEEMTMHLSALRPIFEELLTFAKPGYVRALQDKHVSIAQSDARQGERAHAEVAEQGEGGAGAAAGGGEAGEDGEGEVRSSKAVSGDKVVAALSSDSAEPVHVFRSDNPEIVEMSINLASYCPVTIVERDNLLLPGNPANGLVLYKGKLYSFVGVEALHKFMKDPTKYIEGVLLGARRAPELINLLNLEQHFPNNVLKRFLGDFGGDAGMPKTAEIECQTPTHFVEKRIEPKYDWNEWSLRRKAIQLANLHNKLTHSTQTHHSHFRRESETQVYLPKAGVTQTATDRGTRPVQHLQYISGLRGHPDQEMTVVKVDVDLQ